MYELKPGKHPVSKAVRLSIASWMTDCQNSNREESREFAEGTAQYTLKYVPLMPRELIRKKHTLAGKMALKWVDTEKKEEPCLKQNTN